MAQNADMFAKDDDDDENIPDFVVFPPLPLDISADYDGNILEVDNVNVDIVAFAPTPGCNGVLIAEFIDHPSDTGSTTDSMPASHSLPGFPGFSATSATESAFPILSSGSGSASASVYTLPTASGSVSTLGSASSSSYSLKTVATTWELGTERDICTTFSSVLSIEQVGDEESDDEILHDDDNDFFALLQFCIFWCW